VTRPTDTPNRLMLRPLEQADPRLSLDERALVDASRNRFPVVAGRTPRRDTAGLAAGGAMALMLGGLTFWSMSGHRAPPAPAPKAAVPAATPTPAPPPVLQPPGPAPGLILPAVPSVANAPGALPEADRPATAPVMVYDASSAPAPAITPAAPDSPATTPAVRSRPPTMSGDNEQFASRIGEGEVQVATAQAMVNPARTVTQGTLIPAVLETAIDTDLPGYVRALVSQDVRSFDGSAVLIPRSSRLIGQYKSGLAAGQTRAYVIWSRLIRPDGASVALASPAVEFGGNSGLAGKVDGHFMKRFGSAVLLSVVGGLGALGSGGTAVVLQGGGQSAAGVAAARDTAIPPTIRVRQGQPIRIFTARDLDFSTVPAVAAGR